MTAKMNFRTVLPAICLGLSPFILPAAAEDSSTAERTESSGIYFAARGYGAIEDHNNFIFDNSREIAFAVGHRPHENFRVELEYGTRWSDISGLNGASGVRGKARVQTVGLHALYDFRAKKNIRPFVGAGIGGAMLNFKFAGPADINPAFIVEGEDYDFSHYFSYFAGVTFRMSPTLRIGTGVEYVTLKDDTINSNIGPIEGINRSYNYFVSARWFFGERLKR